MARIIEGSHYIEIKGPTRWSTRGWGIAQSLRQPGDRTILLVDNLHGNEAVSRFERDLPNIAHNFSADITVMESALHTEALQALALLGETRHVKSNRYGKFFCQNGASTCQLIGNDTTPFVVLLDAGFTLLKHRLGYDHAINVLPHFYEREQRNLLKIVDVLLPGFTLEVVLFNLEGVHWTLPAGT